MPTSPLRDAASGGELSRLMLALAGQGAPGGAATYVFDEIDAGVGGNTAKAVGERLRALGEERQVLCITHLPQVASMAADALPDREERRSGPGDRARSSGSMATSWSRRSSGCSAASDGDEAADRHARQLLEGRLERAAGA